MKLFSPDSAHWYQRDGQPLHTVLSAKGEPRATTLRDARKLGPLWKTKSDQLAGPKLKTGMIENEPDILRFQEIRVVASVTSPL